MQCSTNLVDECNKSCEEGKRTGSSRLRPKRPFLLKRKKTITSTEYDKLIHHITYLKILFTILNLLCIFVTVITIPCKTIRKQNKRYQKTGIAKCNRVFFTTSCVVPIASCFLDGCFFGRKGQLSTHTIPSIQQGDGGKGADVVVSAQSALGSYVALRGTKMQQTDADRYFPVFTQYMSLDPYSVAAVSDGLFSLHSCTFSLNVVRKYVKHSSFTRLETCSKYVLCF